MPPPRHLGVVIIWGLVVLVLALAGVLRSLDGWAFDRLVEWSPSPVLSSRSVLVVANDRDLGVPEITDLAERLHRMGARATVFACNTPEPIDAGTTLELAEWKACVTSGWPESSGFPEDVPVSAPPGGIWRGILPAPRSDRAHPVLEPGTAQLLGISPAHNGYYLDFRVRRDGFQRVDADRLLSGDLPRSLVEGKVVLIGNDGPAESLITTPVHRGAEALSPVLLQAAIIDALDRDGTVRLASAPTQWSIAFILAALFVAILWRQKQVSALWLTVAGCGVAVAAAWLFLWQFQWWLPPAKAMVLFGAAGTAASTSRAATQRTTLRRMLRNLAVDAQERASKGRFLTAASPWTLVEETLHESFCFEPSFVLRLDPRSGTLSPATESGAEACRKSFADTSLDVDHEPFADAARRHGATLEDGLVVIPIGPPESLCGFWVFHPADPDNVEQATAFADRLAVMLQRRMEWRRRARPHQLESNDVAALRVQPLHDQIEGSFELLDGGRKVLAEALDRSMDAVLAYDPFGDLIHVSSRAADLLGPAGIDFAGTTPAVLLASLTAADPAELRRTLRFVALSGEQAAFKVSPGLVTGREFFLHVRSLSNAALAGPDDGPGLPGLLVMIEDVTQIARAAVLKDEFLERIYFQLNNDFAAILAASALLKDPRVDAEGRSDLLTMINEKIEEAAGRMKETRSHLGAEFSPSAVERYPVRFRPVFDAALASVAAQLESHQVIVEPRIAGFLQLVLAAPKPLEDLLHAILLTLVHDSREESRITVEAVQSGGNLSVILKNEGFGMPQEKLQGYLEQGDGGHDTLKRIGVGVVTVGAWGGTLTVRSEVGTGMTFELNLVNVI